MDNSKQEQNIVFSLGKDSLLQKRSLSVVQIPPSARTKFCFQKNYFA